MHQLVVKEFDEKHPPHFLPGASQSLFAEKAKQIKNATAAARVPPRARPSPPNAMKRDVSSVAVNGSSYLLRPLVTKTASTSQLPGIKRVGSYMFH